MVDTSVDETERLFWYDDPQGRAPMTEALDDIAKLCARIDELEAERNAAITEIGAMGRKLGECQAERDTLKAALSEIATFDKWSHAPGQCPMGCNAPEVAKKVLGVEISTGWEKLPD